MPRNEKAFLFEEVEYAKNKLMMELVRDYHAGRHDEELLENALALCGVSRPTWDSYLYAYTQYKKYQNAEKHETKIVSTQVGS